MPTHTGPTNTAAANAGPDSTRPEQTSVAHEVQLNVALLSGVVRTEPITSELDDGTIRLTFDLVVASPSQSVPVTWVGRVSRAPRLRPGGTASVVGRVRRHFFRVNGATQTRTDVLATSVAVSPAKRRSLLERALAELSDGATPN